MKKVLQCNNIYAWGRADLSFPAILKPQKGLYLANTFLAPPPRGVAALVSVSDDKIQTTILILRRGALSKFLTCSSVFSTATFLTKTFRVAFLSSRPQSGSRQVSDWLLSGWLLAQEVFRHLAEEHGIGADKLVQMGGHGREYPTAYFCTKEHWPPVYHFLFKWHVLICPMITDNNVIGVTTIQTFKQVWTYAVVSEIDTILFVPPFRWFIM